MRSARARIPQSVAVKSTEIPRSARARAVRAGSQSECRGHNNHTAPTEHAQHDSEERARTHTRAHAHTRYHCCANKRACMHACTHMTTVLWVADRMTARAHRTRTSAGRRARRRRVQPDWLCVCVCMLNLRMCGSVDGRSARGNARSRRCRCDEIRPTGVVDEQHARTGQTQRRTGAQRAC